MRLPHVLRVIYHAKYLVRGIARSWTATRALAAPATAPSAATQHGYIRYPGPVRSMVMNGLGGGCTGPAWLVWICDSNEMNEAIRVAGEWLVRENLRGEINIAVGSAPQESAGRRDGDGHPPSMSYAAKLFRAAKLTADTCTTQPAPGDRQFGNRAVTPGHRRQPAEAMHAERDPHASLSSGEDSGAAGSFDANVEFVPVPDDCPEIGPDEPHPTIPSAYATRSLARTMVAHSCHAATPGPPSRPPCSAGALLCCCARQETIIARRP